MQLRQPTVKCRQHAAVLNRQRQRKGICHLAIPLDVVNDFRLDCDN